MHLRNILLAVGVFALVAGASLAVLWLTQRPATVAVSTPSAEASGPGQSSAPKSAKAILIAAHPIPSGTLLRPEDVTWKEVPGADAKPTEIAHDEGADSKYLGALTTKEFAAGEPLLTSSLIKPGDRGFLAALLAPGTRAVSIAVEATQSASGLLLPDNRVDIILTQTFENDADPARKSVGETILKNLRVIAVDRRLGPALAVAEKPLSLEASIPKIITLEVTEREAETLMVASRLGRLEVTVRSLGRADAGQPGQKDALVSLWAADVSPALKTFKRAVAAPAPTAAPAVSAQTARRSIEVMHGAKIEAR